MGGGNWTGNSEQGGNYFDNLFQDMGNMWGEITGSNAAKEANKMAKDQYEEQKAKAEKERIEAQAQVGKDQMAQSQKAGAARNATKSTYSNKGQAVASAPLGGVEKDFLGL